MSVLSQDKRPILSLWFGDEEGSHWIVGGQDVTEIEAYDEVGAEAMVPWFAVYKGRTLVARVNAAKVETVIYRDNMETVT